MPNYTAQKQKFEELILYLAVLSEGDPKFGCTKLNKLLFYCDFLSFIRLGVPITGQEYQKLEFGPAPRQVVPAMREMQESENLALQKRMHCGKIQQRPIALREPDLSLFSGQEVDLIREVVQWKRDRNATWISHESHQFRGWQLANVGDTIPYETILVGKRGPNAQEQKMVPEMGALAEKCLSNK